MSESTATRNLSEVAALADDFIFSQSSLQTYVDCQRKFWLTYLNHIQWPSTPAAPADEYENLMRVGAAFHRMVQRAEEGIIGDMGSVSIEYPLDSWLRAYLEHRPVDLPTEHVRAERTLETTISVPSGSRRLMAKYDLLASDSVRSVIVDWKTGTKATRPAILQQKMQSSVYPYVLVEASARLPWGPVRPEQVEMRYWFVSAPEQPVVFRYDQTQHAASHDRIGQIVEDILHSGERDDYPMVADTETTRKYVCGFCPYRGYCDRGTAATDLAEIDDVEFDVLADADSFLDFTLDDIDEIPY